ncbi:MAG: hypothetical protein ACYTF7_07765 [Planctomycetota bacterium]|jgi:hypothetical protein
MKNSRANANVLWASACVILAMIITQAARVSPESAAHAGLVAQSGDLSVLTAESGAEHEIVLLLDRFEGTLLVYTVEQRDKLELVQNYDIASMLNNAAGAAGRTTQ